MKSSCAFSVSVYNAMLIYFMLHGLFLKMSNEKMIRASFVEQAGYCKNLGSPFTHDVLIALSKILDQTTETGRRVLSWATDPAPKADALALRLAGGFHALALSQRNVAFSKWYAGAVDGDRKDFEDRLADALQKEDLWLCEWLRFPPQTNEVARASIIYAGLCVIAQRFRLPLALYEMGCSGGLNLQAANFAYRVGDGVLGNPESELVLSPDWSGARPPHCDIAIVSRNGCDLNPLHVAQADDRMKLMAYIWADQKDRLKRVRAAIEISRRDPPELVAMGAEKWVEKMLAGQQEDAGVRVFYSTIAWNYFPHHVKDSVQTQIQTAGNMTDGQSPLVWLRFEFADDDSGPFLTLQTWPNGEEEVLASSDAHVKSIKWLL